MTKKSSVRKKVVEALERKACGPLFGQSDDPIFRLAVGAFFTVKTVGEMQKDIEDKADKIMATVAKSRKRRTK